MAQLPQDDEKPLAFFPSPPPFYEHFTAENLTRLEEFKEQYSPNAADVGPSPPGVTTSQILELPAELRYLIPPEPPVEGDEYHVFGRPEKLRSENPFDKDVEWISTQLWDTESNLGVLKDWKYERLYMPPPEDDVDAWPTRQRYLFRFARSIMLSYLELLGIMATNPGAKATATVQARGLHEGANGKGGEDEGEMLKDAKMKDILTLVLNMQELINEYRPHQARETLIRLMEEQVRRKKDEVARVKAMSAKIEETLQGFGEAALRVGAAEAEVNEHAGFKREEEARVEAQRGMWAALHEIMGP